MLECRFFDQYHLPDNHCNLPHLLKRLGTRWGGIVGIGNNDRESYPTRSATSDHWMGNFRCKLLGARPINVQAYRGVHGTDFACADGYNRDRRYTCDMISCLVGRCQNAHPVARDPPTNMLYKSLEKRPFTGSIHLAACLEWVCHDELLHCFIVKRITPCPRSFCGKGTLSPLHCNIYYPSRSLQAIFVSASIDPRAIPCLMFPTMERSVP